MSAIYIARSRAIAARQLGTEMMIMCVRDSSLFDLNETATILWQAADGVTPLHEIVRERICSELEVDIDSALCDAQEFVQSLARHGILEVSDQPILAPRTFLEPIP
jgi:hypothetical protein